MTKSIKIFLIVAFAISICFIITFVLNLTGYVSYQLFDKITKYYIYLGLLILTITFIVEKQK